jgi:hypothetical protein
MKRIAQLLCRLLCIVALAGASAFAQSSATASPAANPVLASERTPALAQSNNAQPDNAWSDGAQANAAQATAAKPSAARTEEQSSVARLESSDLPAYDAGRPQLQSRANSAEALLPVATVLHLKLVMPISTVTARRGEKFFATLTQPVVVNGRTIIPSGTSVTCRVDDAHAGRRFAGKPSITVHAYSVHLPSGEVLDFSASVIDTSNPGRFDVDQEGRVRGIVFSTMNKIETGSLAGAGLITGAALAGPQGLFIGAASGAALGAGYILSRHKELTLPAGTELIFELDTPATVASAQGDEAQSNDPM